MVNRYFNIKNTLFEKKKNPENPENSTGFPETLVFYV